MNPLYRISCECGQVIEVSPARCGTSLRCSCGRIVVVPSWRELTAQNSPAEKEPASGAPFSPLAGWTTVLRGLGVLLVAGSVVGATILYANTPRLPNLHKVPPAAAYTYLKILKTGIAGAIPPAEVAYIRQERIWRGLWDLVSSLAVIGALLVIGVSLAEWWEEKSQQIDGEEEAGVPIAGANEASGSPE